MEDYCSRKIRAFNNSCYNKSVIKQKNNKKTNLFNFGET